MGRHPIVKGIKIALFVVIASVALGFIVKSLWNVLVPPIIGWHTITFWQALGLLLLSKILFAAALPSPHPWSLRYEQVR